MLRIMRRGDRHDPKELTVSFRFEGDFAAAFREGRADGLVPGEAIKNLVHRTAREHGSREIEEFGIALCDRVLTGHPAITRARVEITEKSWTRLDAGGRPQGQTFMAGTPEVKTAAVTSNGRKVAVVSASTRFADADSRLCAAAGRPCRRWDDGWPAAAARRRAVGAVDLQQR